MRDERAARRVVTTPSTSDDARPVGAREARRAELAAAVAIGLARPAAAPVPTDDDMWSAARAQLSTTQRTQLAIATRLREGMLTLARAGQIDGAYRVARSLAAAVRPLARPSLAADMADTLDAAAFGFVAFKAGLWDEALAQMDAALVAASALAGPLGAAAVHPRRVHLVANQVRVHVAMGAVARAVQTACALLRYLDGDDAAWPRAAGVVETPILIVEAAVRDRQRAQLVDQLRGAFIERHRGASDALAAELDTFALRCGGKAPAWWAWWRAWCADDADRRWAAGLELLAAGRAIAPGLWGEVRGELEGMA